MALPDNVMMKRVYHVSGEPALGILTYTIDANDAVKRFPNAWSFAPWPAPVQVAAVPAAPQAVPANDWRAKVDWKASTAKARATKLRNKRLAREARDAAEAAEAAAAA